MRGAFPFLRPVHHLTYALRRLGILSQAEDSLWISLSSTFRADPSLRLLEELEQDLRQKVQRMAVGCFYING